MGVAQKWHFSTLGGAANLGGVSGDLSDHRGSGITLLGITSLNRHFNAQIDWTIQRLVTSITSITPLFNFISLKNLMETQKTHD